MSVFDQIMEGLPKQEQEAVLKAFTSALKEDDQQYRNDAKALEEWATSASGVPCILKCLHTLAPTQVERASISEYKSPPACNCATTLVLSVSWFKPLCSQCVCALCSFNTDPKAACE